jgi:hypothetical protein
LQDCVFRSIWHLVWLYFLNLAGLAGGGALPHLWCGKLRSCGVAVKLEAVLLLAVYLVSFVFLAKLFISGIWLCCRFVVALFP